MSFVKRTLSLIPRPIVDLVPLEKRDQWRTALLKLEKSRRSRRRTTRTHPGRKRGVRKVDTAIVERVDDELKSIHRRLDELVTRIDQLDARISTYMSGDAPTALDDLADLIEPINELRSRLRQLEESDSTVSPGHLSDAS